MQSATIDRHKLTKLIFHAIYLHVVLFRVGNFKGLFICEKLDNAKSFDIDLKLLGEEEILQ